MEEILGINRTIAKQSLVPIRKGYKYMWESKIKTFLLHKVGGNHREQPFPISISNHKSSTCSLYQAQEWKKNNCKVKNQEFEVEKERVTGWNKKKREEGKPKGSRRISPKYSFKILPNSWGKSNPLPLELVMGCVRLYEKKA